MKRKEGFTLRNVMGESMVMPIGENVAKYEGVVVLNEVSAYVYEQLKNPISKEELLDLLLQEFEVEKETAEADLTNILERFTALGLLEV